MAETSNFVIQYLADISSVKTEIKKLESINKAVSTKFSQDFTKAVTVLDRRVTSLKTSFNKLGEPKVLAQITTKFKQADGTVKSLVQTVKEVPESTAGAINGFKILSENVVDTGKSIKTFDEKVSSIVKPVARLSSEFNNAKKVNKEFASDLGKQFTKATNIVKKNVDSINQKKIKFEGKNVIVPVQKLGAIVKTTDGRFKQLTKTITTLPDGTVRATRSVKDLGTSYKKLETQIKKTNTVKKKATKVSEGLGQTISKLTNRALVTIPVWLALRSAIIGIPRAIGESLRALIEFDRALQKARRSLRGTPEQIEEDFQKLREESTKLATQTGVDAIKIANAFQKFATVGFDTETALRGATDATKLSVLLFGDAEEAANAFARSMKVLIDDSEGATSQSQQISEAIALTAELWKDNAFELSEFTASLENFAGTAKTANFTTRESISLLATLSSAALRGAKGGRLLRTSVQKLVQNLDKLAPVLGIKVNPELDTTFGVLIKVTDAVGKLTKASKLAPEATEAISEIFGGVRGAQPVRALIALGEELKKNLAVQADVAKFNTEVEKVTDTVSRQADRFKVLKVEMGKAFVTGLIGGEDFLASLKRVNKALDTIIPGVKQLGKGIRQVFRGGFSVSKIIAISARDLQVETSKVVEKIEKEISKGLKGELTDIELKGLIVKLVKGELKVDVSEQTFTELGKQLSKQLSDDFKDAPVDVQTKINAKLESEEGGRQVQFAKRQQDISKILLKDQLQRLKALGATSVQILKAENNLSKQLGIEEKGLDILERQLATERAITEERRLRNRLSSESVKLFRIAQEEGTQVAKKLGEVLAGDRDFATFVKKGGKELEIFKRDFSDIFEQQQALEFFRGGRVPGIQGLKGGASVPISEEAIRRSIPTFDPRASLQRSQAERALSRIEQRNVINNTFNITGVDAQQVAKIIEEKFSEGLDNPSSKLSRKLTEKITGDPNISL